jgi:hypothetical protein
VAWGGAAEDDNLVTTCWPCNARKGDLTLARLGWQLLPVDVDDTWDGLTRFYRDLWHQARCANPKLHHDWANALDVQLD